MVITIRDTTTGTEYVNGRNHWSFHITIKEKVDFSYSSVRRHYANESVDSFHGLYHLRNLYSIGSVESMQSRTSMRGRSRDQSSKRGINHRRAIGRRCAQRLPYTLTAHNVRVTLPSIHLSFSSAEDSLNFCHHKGHRQSLRMQRFRQAYRCQLFL